MHPSSRSPLFVVDNVSKKYVLNSGQLDTKLFSKANARQKVPALKGVSLHGSPGEFLGLLGQNGSGKSTLLRLLAGQESPTTGQILTTSRPSLLGISAALQTYLTGAQNIYIGCLALGMSPSQARAAAPEIEALADIGDAIHRPMQTYSAGMAGRLKFAISTAISPEILLIDEALSAGDASFADRAKQRVDELTSKAGVAVLVSHSTSQIESMCSRALWLHEGLIIADGPVDTITGPYRQWADLKAKGNEHSAKALIRELKKNYVEPKYEYQKL